MSKNPYDNSDDFNRDKYGNNVEATKRYFEKRDELLEQIQPLPGEMLWARIKRLQHIAHRWEEINLQSHIYGRKIWFTHKNPSSCWLCDGIIIINVVIDEMSNMANFHPDAEYLQYQKHSTLPKSMVLINTKDAKDRSSD